MAISINDAVVSSIYGPDLEKVRIYDEYFHVKQASIRQLPNGADVDGSISRVRENVFDDQVYYSVAIRNSSIENRNSWWTIDLSSIRSLDEECANELRQ